MNISEQKYREKQEKLNKIDLGSTTTGFRKETTITVPVTTPTAHTTELLEITTQNGIPVTVQDTPATTVWNEHPKVPEWFVLDSSTRKIETTTLKTLPETTTSWVSAIQTTTEEIKEEEEETTTTTSTEPTTTATETTSARSRQRQPEPATPELKNEERDVTIVTGLIDIGRGDWWQYRRPLEKYHMFMENVLSLRNKMVIFVDDHSYDFALSYRKKLGLEDMTRVYKISIEELPLYGYINEAREIIKAELANDTFYSKVADEDMKTHPESKSAEYNIVVNSKTHFLHNVTIDNPFDTDYFIWLDAGYGHGNQSVFPYNNVWRPAFPDKKISLIKLTPVYDKLSSYNLDKLYRKNWAVLSGGFIAGDKHSIGQLHHLISRKFVQLIYQKYVDDDQTLLVLAVNGHPHLFNIVHGDWFDAFKLFSVDAEEQLG
ncbi:unnamed protein product [Caenorhabditis bovis]|uniref:Uncharacterized protein n=1 Tax=Caenorhabditis bovis TaxID=2654633 RepID=A0A8S1E856_9PELO|nr:unnamed protein product [Caenorhabditis bovis]